MLKISALEQINDIKERYNQQLSAVSYQINICAGTGCIANGALRVYEEFLKQLEKYEINLVVNLITEEHTNTENSAFVYQSGCHGFCQMGPLVDVHPLGVLYTRVKPSNVNQIIERTILKGEVIEELLYHDHLGNSYKDSNDIPFYSLQKRNTLDKCGSIDSTDINAYLAGGGYTAAFRV